MVKGKELEKYKQTIQNIIDKYLPEKKRFSVNNFTEEGLYYLASLFLEKDPEKRKNIYAEVEIKRKEAEERLRGAEYNFLELENEIVERKEEYDKIFNTIGELYLLSNDIDINQELDSNLNQF